MKKCMPRKKNAKQLVNNLEKFYYDALMKYENTQNWLNVSPVSSSVKNWIASFSLLYIRTNIWH